MSELIVLEPLSPVLFTTDDAKEIASNLHTEMAVITVVNDPATQASAVAIATKAQGFLKQLEAGRKAVKAPVIEMGRQIDALADELASPVKEQMQRVGAMVAKYQTAEAQRVQQERIDREKREREAMEAARRAAELERKAAEQMKDEAGLAKAVEAEAEAKRKEAEMYAELTKPQPAAVKAKGSVTKQVLRWEVTDLHALYVAAPHLCKLEPNVMAIKTCCNAQSKIPGLRVWTELDTTFRA
jgi:hypothetical protein